MTDILGTYVFKEEFGHVGGQLFDTEGFKVVVAQQDCSADVHLPPSGSMVKTRAEKRTAVAVSEAPGQVVELSQVGVLETRDPVRVSIKLV